jgi:spermidine synthase
LQPWILIDQASTPDGAALELWRRGTEYSIRTAGHELMSSRVHGSEARLAELALAALGDASRARVLIGGLGCGYTLAAALPRLGPAARVVVDEISEAVIGWNRAELGVLAGRPLDDRRVDVRPIDVIDDVKRVQGEFDVILLDVDNGPSALSQARNAWLYGKAGLARLALALSPSGVLGVWSAGADAQFLRRMRAQQFRVEEHRVPAHGARGKRHTLWIAQRSR